MELPLCGQKIYTEYRKRKEESKGGVIMEYATLNNGVKMPMAGIGTFLLTPDEAENAVWHALKEGYRLIDTANAYVNEKAVGRAMKKSGVDRSEIFLETKLWPSFYEQDDAVEKTLARLDTDYIDLLLIHQPAVHPYDQEKKLKAFLAKSDMVIQAWYPLGHGDAALLQEPVFAKLGEKYKKSPAQIILRWHIQDGNVVIPGSKNPDHIRDNFALFDFSLTEEEMAEIGTLDQNKRYYTSTPELLEKYVTMVPPVDEQK